jgi:hypothetical protein
MESLAMTPAEQARPEERDGASKDDGGLEERTRRSRASVVPRSQARPGMSFGHDVLLALIMAVAMAATVFLYR